MRVRRRKHIALHRGPAPVPAGPTERWSMDFVHDALTDGRPFRVLTVVDQWSRQSPILEVASSLSARVAAPWIGRSDGMACGRSPSITGRNSCPGVGRLGVSARRATRFHRPGKPVENAFIEAFNGRLRDECLNVHQFMSLDDAKSDHRSLARRLQSAPTAQLARAPDPVRSTQQNSVREKAIGRSRRNSPCRTADLYNGTNVIVQRFPN